MPSLENMRERLPLLYRPEANFGELNRAGDTSLLSLLLAAVGAVLDDAHADSTTVLQSHWLRYADSAFYSPYVERLRQVQGLPRLMPTVAADVDVAEASPYIRDLARLGSLLSLQPWYEPSHLRELVEAYRLRLRRIVALYQNGLGTLDALRRMIEAQLPVDLTRPLEERDPAFTLEELAPLVAHVQQVPTRGDPQKILGPMMRWEMANTGARATLPTIYIRAEEETLRPVIELYTASNAFVRLGIAYTEGLQPGKTLRLRPAYNTWLGREDGVQRADATPDEAGRVNPTAAGPWTPSAGAPTTPVAGLHQTPDRILWVATNDAGKGQLWRHDGQSWRKGPSHSAELHSLADDGESLLAGADDGLLRVGLYPADGDPFTAEPVAGLDGIAVHTIYDTASGERWLGTSDGAGTLAADGTFTPSTLQGTPVYAIHEDSTSNLFFGGELGLFQHQVASDAWFYYAGTVRSEEVDEWQPWTPGELPDESNVGLPPVRCIWRGPDAALWLGTEQGIARYRARSVRGLTYETILEAFPDLTTDRVYTLGQDARGLLWFGTGRGLFRYDGRDWWQLRESTTWVQLGRADSVYTDPNRLKERGAWWFQRATGQWQRFDEIEAVPLRSTEEPAVTALLWTDNVAADKGTWDGSTFTSDTPVPNSDLRMRYKPEAARIVTGGLPAAPRLPAGSSVWRYLSMEPDPVGDLPEGPAWTAEGRFLPPIQPEAPEHLADQEAPGRYDVKVWPPPSVFNAAVFAFDPVARLWLTWQTEGAMTVVARLQRRGPDEEFDPAVLDRVWQGMEQVRPAGIRVKLAVEEEIVRPKGG
jgi:hypothetical protein